VEKKEAIEMIQLDASFRIVTPLFMSGADNKIAELRAASIRGVLRFWWRALALGHCNSWKDVRNAEFALFGSSSGGKSRIHTSLAALQQSKKRHRIGDMPKDGSRQNAGPGALYLGYGAISAKPFLDIPLKFNLRIYLQPPCNKIQEGLHNEADLLEGALKAMGLLGGLGSRSRRGLGSITLLDLKRDGKSVYEMPNNLEDYLANVIGFFHKHVITYKGIPEYTAFAQDTMVYLLETGNDPLRLLDKIGQKMNAYRSWKTERNFKKDHDYMRDALFTPAADYPLRVAFGLPHNYHFSKAPNLLKPNVEVVPDDKNGLGHNRRASPLFFHIHEISKDCYVVIATIFPSAFLPVGEGVLIQRAEQYGGEQNVPTKTLAVKSSWHKELNKFLESQDPSNPALKRFGSFKIIWP